MNTHDKIELPEPKYPGTKANIPNAIPDLYTADQVRAAIEADRKRHYRPIYVKGWKDALEWAERKRRGEPVAMIRHFHYQGIARSGLVQEAVMLDGVPALPDGAMLYTAPQPTSPIGYITPAAVVRLREGNFVSLCPTDIDNGLPVYLTQPAEPVKAPNASPPQAPTPLSDAYAAVEACHAIKPFLDTVICYASTTSDYEGNRAVKLVEDVCAAFPLTGNAKN